MIHALVQHIVDYLHLNPHAAGIIVFAIACGEALAVVGTVIPGSVTMTAVGILIGSRVIPLGSTIIWAMIGAIVGDCISYGIGFYYKKRIHKIWPFKKYPNLLAKGESFFRLHGGKSIIIGRFFGPARSMVPLVAGTFNMRPTRFLLAAVPSACAWAVCYMVPGILIGAISLELPHELAFEFLAFVLVFIAVCVGITWVIQHYSRRIAKKIDLLAKDTWKKLRQSGKSHWVTRLLSDPRHPRNHRQLILSFYLILTVVIFCFIAVNVFAHGLLTAFNIPVAHLLRSIRTQTGDAIMLSFTIFGSYFVMFGAAFLLFLWFCWKRQWRVAVHWALVVILIGVSVEAIKWFWFSPRPGFLLNGPINSSFPSGHTTLTTALIGFLAMLVSHELRFKARRIPYIVGMCLVGLVGFSRLYLGAHWLTDILGGVFLGLSIAEVATLSYRRGKIKHINLKKFLVVIFSVYLLVWAGFIGLNFNKLKHDYTIAWPSYSFSMQQWLNHKTTSIPLYRPSRLGHPVEVFNIEWVGSLQDIKNMLTKQGWTEYPADFTLEGLLSRLATSASHYPLPLLPQTYQNDYPALLMTKDIAGGKQAIILRLWRSHITIADAKAPFWLGVVNYQTPYHKWATIRKIYGHRKFLGAVDEFIPYITGFKWQRFAYPVALQPSKLHKLHWNGKLLLIK